MDLSKVGVACSPLSGKLRIVRVGKDPRIALDQRDAEDHIIGAVIEHMMFDSPNGSVKTITRLSDGQRFELTCVPRPPATSDADESGWEAGAKALATGMTPNPLSESPSK